MKIFKYIIESTTKAITVHAKHTILSVQSQNDNICAWVLVDEETPKDTLIKFAVVPTGQEFDQDVKKEVKFLNTVQLHNGRLVLHVFRIIE